MRDRPGMVYVFLASNLTCATFMLLESQVILTSRCSSVYIPYRPASNCASFNIHHITLARWAMKLSISRAHPYRWLQDKCAMQLIKSPVSTANKVVHRQATQSFTRWRVGGLQELARRSSTLLGTSTISTLGVVVPPCFCVN